MTLCQGRTLLVRDWRIGPYLLFLLGTTVAYFGAAKIGLFLADVAPQVSAVWPPTGLALAAVLLLGYRIWPAIAFAAFWVNFQTFEPIGTALGIAAGNTLEAVVGAWLLLRLPGFTPSLNRLKDGLGLIVFGALLSTAISATVGAISLCLGGVHPWSAFGPIWRVWWLGDVAGALVVAPALLTWSTRRRRYGAPARFLEAAILATVSVSVALVVFAGRWPMLATGHPLKYVVFPLVIWAALRFGPRGTASVTLVTSAVAIWGAVQNLGPFSHGTFGQNLIMLQVFMAVVAVTSLLLGAVASERSQSQYLLMLDVAQRTHAEEELREADRHKDELLESLREADRRKDEFLAMLSHELRNPLAPIRNAVHILKLLPKVDPRIQQCRDLIDRQVRHLSRLVDDLLDVSRISRGKVQLRRERLDLARLVRTTAEDRRTTLRQSGLALEVNEPKCPVWMDGDSTRLAQALGNLLDNSAKFTDSGGRVSICLATEAERHQAVVTVRDTGIGIEPDVLPRLFEPFAQADRSLDRSRGGLGLGLALVKGLIEMHGGTVSAVSAGPGQGSEFTVRLPIKPEQPALSRMLDHTPAGADGTLRVLVVEDNRDAAESLRLLLELLGHEVRVAATGPEGIELAHAWQPDVVLCDIGLPGLDGYGVAGQLRRDPATSEARLIAITGYGQEEDLKRSQRAGFDAHLTKPVDPDVLWPLLNAAERDRS